MHSLFKVFLLLLCLAIELPAQTVTFPSPETIATKEWVLEQIAKSKDSISPVPPVIVIDNCKDGPTILRIYAITPTSLTAQFHGVDVFKIKWTVTQRLSTLATGEIQPTSSIIAIPLPALKSGKYDLKLEGVNCKGSSIKEFEVPKDTGGGGGEIPVPVPPTGDIPRLNYAVDCIKSGDWEARFITGDRVSLTLTDKGVLSDNFGDKYDKKQRYLTINGEKYNAFYLLDSKPIDDLKNLQLDAGTYYFQKIYARASKFPNWEAVNAMPWTLSPENQDLISVTNTELTLYYKGLNGSSHNWHQPAFYPQFVYNHTPVSQNKVLGFKNQYSVPDATIVNANVTHLQDTGGYNNITPDRKFTLAKLGTAGGNAYADAGEFFRQGYNYALNTGVNRKLILTSEIGEELDNKPNSGNKIEKTKAFVEGYVEAFKERYPNISVSEIGVYGEYGGVGNQGSPGTTYNKSGALTAYRLAMSSEERARMLYEPSKNSFSATMQSTYFGSGKYGFQNVLIRQYFSSLADLNGGYFPSLVYISEKMYIAAQNRRQLIFSWEGIQDLIRLPNNYLDIADGWSYIFKEPAGRLYVGNNMGTSIPPYIGYGLGFLCPLLTEGVVVWSGSGDVKDIPVDGNQRDIFGGDYGNNKWTTNGNIRKWLPEGGKDWQDYGSGGQGMPDYYQNTKGGFSKLPLTAVDAFYAGSADFARIEGRTNKVKYWVKHSTDGGKTWYTPNQGSRGLELSSLNKPNFNDKNPALDITAFRLPICIVGEGDAGSVLIYYNTYKLPTDSDNVVIEHGGKKYNIGQLRGSKLHLIKL